MRGREEQESLTETESLMRQNKREFRVYGTYPDEKPGMNSA